jgi:hypothetical protein
MKPAVCIDMDVLLPLEHALIDSGHISGDPLPAAVALLGRLAENLRIIIHAPAPSILQGDDVTLAQVQQAVENWVRDHGLHCDRVSVANEKPVASAYIDQTFLTSLPQPITPEEAYDTAGTYAEMLCGVEGDEEKIREVNEASAF